MAVVSYDVDSIWATSNTLGSFRIPNGIHRCTEASITQTVVADFTKKSSIGVSYNAFFLVTKCQFPVQVFLNGASGRNFFTLVFIPSLNDLSKDCVSSYYNGRWLWADDPHTSFKAQAIKTIALHTEDFPALEENFKRHLQQNFPHATMLFGIYQNGLRGNYEDTLRSLKAFVSPASLNSIAVHKAMEVTVPTGTVSLAREVRLRGCVPYYILGSPSLRSFTCNSHSGLPDMCMNVRERITYVQGYYPRQAHAGNVNDHTNSPITLAAIFGFNSGNSLLDGLLKAAKRELEAIRASLFSFASESCPYRIEIATEWKSEQPVEELERIFSAESLNTLADNIFDGCHFEVITEEEIGELMNEILLAYMELEEMVNGRVWPATLEDIGRIASLESLLLYCVRGSTSFVNYNCLKAALGGKTLGLALGSNGALSIPLVPSTVPAELLVTELTASEQGRFHNCVLFFVQLLVRFADECERTGNAWGTCQLLARTIIEGVAEECGVAGLTVLRVTAVQRRVSGCLGLNDALDCLRFIDTIKPMRTLLALLTTHGAAMFCKASNQELEAALRRALQTCQVFPLWRPQADRDSSYTFLRLCPTPPERQFSDGMEFLLNVLKLKVGMMQRLSSNNKDVQGCLRLAIHLAGGEGGMVLRKWTACLLLLLLTVWRGPRARRCFSLPSWQDHFGWVYLQHLCEQGILCREEHAEGCSFFGNYKIARGFPKNIERWGQSLHRQQVIVDMHDATQTREEQTAEDRQVDLHVESEQAELGVPTRKRRRGIAMFLSSQQ